MPKTWTFEIAVTIDFWWLGRKDDSTQIDVPWLGELTPEKQTAGQHFWRKHIILTHSQYEIGSWEIVIY